MEEEQSGKVSPLTVDAAGSTSKVDSPRASTSTNEQPAFSALREQLQDLEIPGPEERPLDWQSKKTATNTNEQARMLAALETGGLASLAMEMLATGDQLRSGSDSDSFETWRPNPLRDDRTSQKAFVQVMNCLVSLSPETLTSMLEGTFGVDTTTDKVRSMRLPIHQMEKKAAKDLFPCIYVMTLQNDKAERPTVEEVEQILKVMEEYIDFTPNAGLQDRDYKADCINSATGPEGRDWTCSPTNQREWKYEDSNEKSQLREHPRRYFENTMPASVRDFAKACRSQMQALGPQGVPTN